MTLQQILLDVTAAAGAFAAICTILAHLPFMPPAWAERFARFALYASQVFSVNRRDTLPKPKDEDPKLPPIFPGAAALFLAACFASGFATSCALFGSQGSVWPAIGTCAPTPETLFSEVESVLTSSGGNYEDDLLALGKAEGLSLVECAVQAVVQELSSRIAARKPGERITPDEGLGVARGKAFLAKIAEAHK